MNEIDFSNIKSIEELKNLGTLSKIKKELLEIVFPMSFEAKSFEELFAVLKKLQDNWLPLTHNSFFISKQAEIIFCLLYVIPKYRNPMLGISDDLYVDKDKAREWYLNLCKIVHPDNGGNSEAFGVLKKLYDNMIEDDYDDK